MISILYYDHDPAWREQAERWLSRDGAIEAVPAGTFDEAVALFRGREFDAVVADPLDDEVPGTLSIVRTHEPPIPFILLMEPGHEQVVIQALNSGADRYVEKSGDPTERLRALAGAIEEMVAKEPTSAALQRRNEELEFLSRTAMDFIRMGDEEDIYRSIGEKVHSLLPECYIVILLFDKDTRLFTFRNLIAGEPARRIVREELGFDLEGMSLPLDKVPSVEKVLGCDRLVEVITTLYQATFKMLPEEACNRIEERTDAGKYYSMGFNCRDGLYGVLTIGVRKGGEIAHRGLIEAFVRQASVALLRQHVRARLRESEARYRAVVESQRELICRFTPDGTHRFANEAYCRFFGLDPGGVVGARFHSDLPADERDGLRAYFARFSPESPDGTIEHRVRRPDGSTRWLQWHNRAFFDRSGAIVEFQTVGRDVTERREAEEALAALTAGLERRVEERTAELQAANRDLESFTYSVSHDLRAPLRAIDGYTGILQHEHRPELTDAAIRYLDQISQNARQMGRLIDDLLTFSRTGRQALAIQEVEPAGIVAEVLDDLAGERQGREVRVRVGGLAPCRADPALLKQVYANLIGNAFKFTRDREVAEIAIGSDDGSGQPVYSVRDNGVGFDQKYATMLFQVFQRLHDGREYEGTGVGLAIVQRIVERHGGRVWAEGEPGTGAAFFFTLGPAGRGPV
jgi:PAS domain S-box-containing protein